MATRGAVGFRVNGKDYVTYNHYDSYPSRLGENTIAEVKKLRDNYTDDELRAKVAAIRFVNGDAKPTKKDQTKFAQYFQNVSTGDDYYSLLRELQGKIGMNVELGVMINDVKFLKDSLFCEWAYIINLDTQMLEVYRGFQTVQHTYGRYANKKPKGWKPQYEGQNFYYAVALVKEYPLSDLPKNLDDSVRRAIKKLKMD